MSHLRIAVGAACLLALLANSCASGEEEAAPPADTQEADEPEPDGEEVQAGDDEAGDDATAEGEEAESGAAGDEDASDVACVGSEEELTAPLGEAEAVTEWATVQWPHEGSPDGLPDPDGTYFSSLEFMSGVADAYAAAEGGAEEYAVRLICEPADQRTQGVTLEWGLQDDSVAGVDHLISLVEQPEGWTVAEVERRSHCRRGENEGLCL